MVVAARGGRVAHSGFLDPAGAAELTAKLRSQGVSVELWGGFAGARRRVVTVFPDHVPEARAALTAVYWAGVHDAEALRSAATEAGVAADQLGDVVAHEDGLSIVTLAPLPSALAELRFVAGTPANPLEVPVERLAGIAMREQDAIVPSLRVDALGAKAFRVSRGYFSKGVAAGRVTLNGKAAGKSSTVAVGDEVFADGLGRFRVLQVGGETRRGNLKVRLEVERSGGA